MLVSLQKNVTFVADLECASTAIERALQSECEVRLLEASDGIAFAGSDHPGRLRLDEAFRAAGKMFVFDMMRSPVEDLYNLDAPHRDRRWAGPFFTSNGRDETILDDGCTRHDDQAMPQHGRVLDIDGRFGANQIASYDARAEGMPYIDGVLDLPSVRMLGRLNVSSRDDSKVDDRARRFDEQRYKLDIAFTAHRRDRRIAVSDA